MSGSTLQRLAATTDVVGIQRSACRGIPLRWPTRRSQCLSLASQQRGRPFLNCALLVQRNLLIDSLTFLAASVGRVSRPSTPRFVRGARSLAAPKRQEEVQK